MRQEWLLLVIAAVFEVGWVMGLKHSSNGMEWLLTIIAIIISFSLLIRSGSKLPVGTAYAVFVGLGTAGTVLLDIIVFGEPFRWMVVLLIVVLLTGVLGLKMKTTVTDEEKGV
ncbi:DMT family transporter [Alkalihalobacillus pseudalcaliphilus]|uniref:DMT family transporter n=1 Tax=Alkalihalobacillus pseudalcaliphilus TaxID=79884 RepID=UPI00064DAEC5|nr:multidrug efflux SMR transporter [Alkalihalobacillus pseudalcaliphilus]KMK78179.1 multidrug resistance protein SMR [Alkalihalobacillus pseudalcaliphilus]